MSQTLTLSNFSDANIRETTKLDANIAVGDVSLSLNFSDDLEEGDFLYLGRLGAESGEIVIVSTVTDSETVVVASPGAIKPHNRFEDATVIFGNQIKIYRALNIDGSQPADNTFEFLDTINIDFDQETTNYVDDTGSSDYWYKYIYRNSSNGEETFLTESSSARGGGIGNYCTVQRIRETAGLTSNRWVSDVTIDEYRKTAQAEVDGALMGLYVVPFTDPVPAKIQDITARIAAGLLLTSPWAGRYASTSSEGTDMLKAARDDLTAIQDKQSDVVVNGVSLAIPNVGGFSMYPDATTANALPEDGGPRFTVADRY